MTRDQSPRQGDSFCLSHPLPSLRQLYNGLSYAELCWVCLQPPCLSWMPLSALWGALVTLITDPILYLRSSLSSSNTFNQFYLAPCFVSGINQSWPQDGRHHLQRGGKVSVASWDTGAKGKRWRAPGFLSWWQWASVWKADGNSTEILAVTF